MKITKAIITAAGKEQSHLPLQTVVDRFGQVRCALELLVDEVVEAGVEELAIVICPGEQERYRHAAGKEGERITFFEQNSPRGYGDALLRAKSFAGDESFLHLVSDHLYVTANEHSCAAQLIQVAERENCAISAIQATRENKLGQFGAVGGAPVARQPGLFEVSTVLEKPTPTVAEQHLIVAGQRAGHYLCLFGMHVLTPTVFELLEKELAGATEGQTVNLSDSLRSLSQSQRYLASELDGKRYNIGEKYGLLLAQLAIALGGEDRDLVLTEMLELVARN